MHIITQKRIREAQARWPEVSDALASWLKIMKKAEPNNAAELKVFFPSVDKVGDLYVFNIGGHRIRLIASVRYRCKRVYVTAILSHKQYDKNRWKNEWF